MKKLTKWFKHVIVGALIDAHTIFSGVPSETQLQEWGYELYVEQENNEDNEDLELVEAEQSV